MPHGAMNRTLLREGISLGHYKKECEGQFVDHQRQSRQNELQTMETHN